MKNKIILVVSIMVFCPVCLFSQQGDQTKLAVLDLNAPDLSESANSVLTDIIRRECVQQGYAIISRTKTIEVLEVMKLSSLRTCAEQDCLVQAGRALGVNTIIGGSLRSLGQKYFVDLIIVDVASGQIAATVTEEYMGQLEELDVPFEKAAKHLLEGRITRKQPKEPPSSLSQTQLSSDQYLRVLDKKIKKAQTAKSIGWPLIVLGGLGDLFITGLIVGYGATQEWDELVWGNVALVSGISLVMTVAGIITVTTSKNVKKLKQERETLRKLKTNICLNILPSKKMYAVSLSLSF